MGLKDKGKQLTPELEDQSNGEEKLMSQFISVGNLSDAGLGASGKQSQGDGRPSNVSNPGYGKSKISGKSGFQDTSSLFTISENNASGQNLQNIDNGIFKTKSSRNENNNENPFAPV